MIYVLCGLPGAGKTTISRQLQQQYHAELYCYDEFIKHHNLLDKRQQMFEKIVSDLRTGKDVILDDLHTCIEWRINLLSAIQNVPCKKVLIVMTTSLEECIRRNSQRTNRLPDFVIYYLNSQYQPPTLDEGWDDIIYI